MARSQVYKSRKQGQPNIRWLDDMLEDIRRMDMKGYADIIMDKRC